MTSPACQPPLFAHKRRSDPSVAAADEPSWTFLDRVDDPAFARVRAALNAWFAAYPAAHQPELRRRLSCGDDVEFHAAWFELYLHELHQGLGFDVEVHPDLPDVPTRPDFGMTALGRRFILEATVLGGSRNSARDNRIARVVAAMNRTRTADFSLFFEIDRKGTTSPPMRAVRREVERWLSTLSWDDERAKVPAMGGLRELPTLTRSVGDWRFTIRAWPRAPAQRRSDRPAIGVYPTEGGSFDHATSLRERLEAKAARYGAPADPLVLAVHLDRMAFHEEDVVVALLGPAFGRTHPSDPEPSAATGARGTGFFRSDSGAWRNTHVAGVLTCGTELRPWSVTRRAPTLWRHPGADAALPSDLPFRTVSLTKGEPTVHDGAFDPADVLGLPGVEAFDAASDWPGTPFERS